MDKTLPMQPSAAKAVGKKLKLRLSTGKHCRRKLGKGKCYSTGYVFHGIVILLLTVDNHGNNILFAGFIHLSLLLFFLASQSWFFLALCI